MDKSKYRDLLFDYPIFCYSRKNFYLSKKKRHYVDNKQFFREDKETLSFDFEDNIGNIEKIIEYLISNNIKYLIISDYQKGALTSNEMEYLLKRLIT